ncbi:MAG: aminotransferase class I/II-fold pyridoxal phosphate-dependent enzyme, partial [Rhodospirillales bacterium]|nr:aminotransferase class I/II-fold pyridoxal phosphate-dependent enzyme [Rhodospirillales bacterium]
HAAEVDPASYSVDLDDLRKQVKKLKPKLITIGGSMNLHQHPVHEIRAIADEVGAWVLFDAAHLSGMFAGGAWKNPLEEGAHLMTMSTYKSLGGPASGLIVTNSAKLAERLDAIAFPGLTANFDAAKSAALAITLLDWKAHGKAYAQAMVDTARALASHLHHLGAPVFGGNSGFTTSHQFALEAADFSGGQAASKKLREAGILACGIGLPIKPVKGDMNGLRFGTPEIVRWGMGVEDMEELAQLIYRVLVNKENTASVAPDVKAFRHKFSDLHYMR